ncbi:MAG: A/G-specific adenine glycosylase [Myxococcota bacterium]
MNVPALLAWYRAHRRRMPWRDEVSPYRTLVSEIMLQQTRVDTVIPYFERFLRDFPTVDALAAAPLERVLERWSGLGYYSRARNLHACAKAIAAAGGFPRDAAGLRALPGVGPYTAGAIASIALGLDEPVVDGNVERVLARQHADARPAKAWLWATARDLLPRGEAGDFNQALMELGATVCAPQRPGCLICPVRASCRGADAPERYPAPPPKKTTPEAIAVAALIRDAGRVLLARRPPTGLLAGLWELPGGMGDDLAAALAGRVRVSDARPLGTVTHVFTHLRLHTTVYAAVGEPVLAEDLRWVAEAELDGMALSTLARRTIALGRAPGATRRRPRAPRGLAPPS